MKKDRIFQWSEEEFVPPEELTLNQVLEKWDEYDLSSFEYDSNNGQVSFFKRVRGPHIGYWVEFEKEDKLARLLFEMDEIDSKIEYEKGGEIYEKGRVASEEVSEKVKELLKKECSIKKDKDITYSYSIEREWVEVKFKS